MDSTHVSPATDQLIRTAGVDPTAEEAWPALELAAWRDTYATLHLWTQIVGKTRLVLAAPVNHWWHVPLYVSARGLTTSAIPYGRGAFEVEFDFLAHVLTVRTSADTTRTLSLGPRSVAEFYAEYLKLLEGLGIRVTITPRPCELPDPILLPDDTVHAQYDAEAANRFWRVLVQADRVMHVHRGRFIGKSSPVHFFWGSFDLAVSRFSGRRAPQRPGAGIITREAYSHEVISVGFWPGSGPVQEAAFYAYAYPEPAGFAEAGVGVGPVGAFYHKELGEFILPYDVARRAPSPDAAVLEFFDTAYVAAATRAGWDRAALERGGGV
ncbi:MAG TPA: DUF5996 family protein [Gemmatimonadaceae bacterium]|nr:DUF5996 family protein [Gemmatimonadaceae bacterium]